MALTVSNTILDEEFRPSAQQTGTGDDNDVAVATFDASAIKTAITALALNLYSAPSGFPQHAEKTNFVSSTNQVSDYELIVAGGGVPTDLYVGGNQVFLYATSNSNVVVGRLGTGTTPDAAGAVVLIIGVEETKDGSGLVTNADMWVCQYAPFVDAQQNLVDADDQLDLSGLVTLKSTYSTSEEVPFDSFADVPSGQDEFALIGPSSGSSTIDLLVTGFTGSTVGTVNVSEQGLGSNSQSVDEGESLRIDIVNATAPDFAKADEASEVHDEANLSYSGGHQPAVNATFEIEQINPAGNTAKLSLFAYETATNFQGDGFNANAISSPGDAVTIDVEDVRILNAAGTDITAAFLARAGASITQNGAGVNIVGLLVHEQVKFSTDGETFNRFTVTNIDATSGKDSFDVGSIKITTLVGGTATESTDVGDNLIFQDDGPSIDAVAGATVPTIRVDESDFATDASASFTGLFTAPDYGADASGTLSYILGVSAPGVDSGLDDTLTGQNVLLTYDSATNTVFGKNTDGDEVFRITVNSGGQVTLDQSRSVENGDTASDDEDSGQIAANLITLTAKAVDSEGATTGDSDTASVGIGNSFVFEDDGPSPLGASPDAGAPNNLEVKNLLATSDAAGQDTSSYVLTPGNDGQQSYVIQGPADAAGDFTWQYFDVDGSGTAGLDEIKGFYKNDPLYTLELESNGSYTFKMIGTLPSTPLPLSSEEIKAGGPNSNSIEVGILGTDPRFVKISATGGPINESNDNVGVTNGNLDTGEALTFQLFNGATLLNFQGIEIGTKSASGGTYGWTAHVVGTPPGDFITGTDEVVLKNGTIIISAADLGGATIDSITITKEGGSTTKIGIDDINILVPPADVQLGFTVELKDGDSDPETASFTVDIDGDNDGDWEASVNALSVINPESSQFSAFASFEADQLLRHNDYDLI